MATFCRSIDDKTAPFSAQTPNPKFVSAPLRTVMGPVLGMLCVPANEPIPTPTLLPAAPVRVNPFRSTITGPCMAVEMVIAATFAVAAKVRFLVTT